MGRFGSLLVTFEWFYQKLVNRSIEGLLGFKFTPDSKTVKGALVGLARKWSLGAVGGTRICRFTHIPRVSRIPELFMCNPYFSIRGHIARLLIGS